MDLKFRILIISIITYLVLAIINLIPIWFMASAFADTYYSILADVISSIVLGVLLATTYTLYIRQFSKNIKSIESEKDVVFRKKFNKLTKLRFYIIFALSFIALFIFSFMARLDFRYFFNLLIFGIIIIATIVLKMLNKRISKQIEMFQGFKSLIANRDKIDMDELKNHFKFDSKTFYNKLLEWSERFDMIIDGDDVRFNLNTVSDFIDELDREYGKWGKIYKLKNKIED